MAQAPTPEVGDVVAGKYRVESVLGRGGMGVVFAARHTISERRVALKWMEADLQNEPDALERFVREARAMGRIEHPNVVGVLDVGTEGSIAYLVMEILRGESLRALMAREGRLPPDRALKTLLPVLEGVEAAHRAGVVHRDLKPENLFVVHGGGGQPVTSKVLDFGISKLTENESKKREARRLTKTGHVVGTPTYMSPEQVRGSTIDARTDVWALSVILYEMLSGTTPFDADNFGALLVAIAVEPYNPLDPKIVPPDLAKVVHRGLAKEPEDRWQSVQDFARALEPFSQARFHEPRPPSISPPAEPVRASAVPTHVAGKAPPLETTKPPMAPGAAIAGAPKLGVAAAATALAPSGLAPSGPLPELDLPSPRPSRGTPANGAARGAPASPTPIRIGRPSTASGETTDTGLVGGSGIGGGSGKRVAIAALAIALVVGLVLVIRGIGNAAREAAFAPTTTAPIATTVPPTAIPVTRVAEPEHGAGVPEPTTTTGTVPSAPPVTEGAPPPTIIGLDPPPATRTHHDVRVRTPVVTIGTGTGAETPPPPTTTTGSSRSGSISRDDF